jgi:hypothetical protein
VRSIGCTRAMPPISSTSRKRRESVLVGSRQLHADGDVCVACDQTDDLDGEDRGTPRGKTRVTRRGIKILWSPLSS